MLDQAAGFLAPNRVQNVLVLSFKSALYAKDKIFETDMRKRVSV